MFITFLDSTAPVISAICRSIGLTRTIDQLVQWDDSQCKLSPGLRIEALIMNVLVQRRPLYKIHHFFYRKDTEKMFGPGINPEDINDDAIGRALDKLADADARKVFNTVALNAIRHEGVNMDVLHGDTTSVSVEGAYEPGSDQPCDLKITFGYSKDKRPDLKQFMYGLVVTNEQIPVIADVLDGNTSDNKWNHKLMQELRSHIKDLDRMVYVADSSLITGPNLEAMREQQVKFISRLPGTFGIESELKDCAWQDGNWLEVGVMSKRKDAASYRVQPYIREIEGIPYRFIVVHSSKLDGRKNNSIDRQLEKKKVALEKAFKALSKREFVCEPDTKEAWSTFLKENGDCCFDLGCEIEHIERQKPAGRGRPCKDTVREHESVYVIKPTLNINADAVATIKTRASCFVLITNLKQQERSDADVLKEYKDQASVEQHFAFIKNPRIVGPVFLKKPRRVEALGYVFLMALLVYSIVQRRVRVALKERGETLEVYDKRQSAEPTGLSVLEHLSQITVSLIDGKRQLPAYMKTEKRVLNLLGLSEDIYLNMQSP